MTKNKKEALTLSAATLFHEKGIGATSIADIAKHADVPVGNVYYYFKTKEDIGIAAAELRQEEFKGFIEVLDKQFTNPLARLKQAARFFAEAKEEYISKGCPIAQMCQTGDVANDPVAQAYAAIYKEYMAWIAEQFASVVGPHESKRYAQQFLSRLLGAALVAKTAQNANILESEVADLTQWLESQKVKAVA